MKIRELYDLIPVINPTVYNRDFHVVDGCELLECISDVDGFVELLRGFRRGDVNFVSDHPDPIEFILDGGVVFGRENGTCIYIGVYIGSGVDLHYFYYCKVSDENS